MASVSDTLVRPQLLDRRQRLEVARETAGPAAELDRLLAEVDAALARIDDGSFGLCEVCHDAIEPDRLLADPLVRYCLDHLTPDEQRDLEQDLALAARIQRGLLPEQHLRAAGWEAHYHWEPLGPVSGDYCDILPPQGDSDDLFFLFGDVSGKGVAAAMLGSQLRATFRSLTAGDHPVERLVERANRIFRESSLSPYFATLVAGRAQPDGEITLCNAGHCPPVLVSGGEVTTVGPTGLPVGTFYSNQYSSRTLRLEAGDSLVLYTDGLSEARNRADEEYGAERLARMVARAHGLPPAELAAACLSDLDNHLAGARKSDDLTLMVLRRTAN
jgi:phosphoserine phosphatase RsbU/P